MVMTDMVEGERILLTAVGRAASSLDSPCREADPQPQTLVCILHMWVCSHPETAATKAVGGRELAWTVMVVWYKSAYPRLHASIISNPPAALQGGHHHAHFTDGDS